MSHLIEHHNEELIKRLNKIEGQVVGIKKMVNSNKDYADILIQFRAISDSKNKSDSFGSSSRSFVDACK